MTRQPPNPEGDYMVLAARERALAVLLDIAEDGDLETEDRLQAVSLLMLSTHEDSQLGRKLDTLEDAMADMAAAFYADPDGDEDHGEGVS